MLNFKKLFILTLFFAINSLLIGQENKKYNLYLQKDFDALSRNYSVIKLINGKKQKIWNVAYPRPEQMSFAISRFCNFYYKRKNDILYFVTTASTIEVTCVEIDIISNLKNGEIKRNRKIKSRNFPNLFYSNSFKIFANTNLIFLVGDQQQNKSILGLKWEIDRNAFFTFTDNANILSAYTPSELVQLHVTPKGLSKYERICAEYEKKMMEKLIAENPKLKMTANDVKKAIESFQRQNNNIKLTEIFKTKLTDEQLKENLCNDKNMQFNLSFSNWVEKNHRKYSDITVSEAEIKKFYEDYGRYLSEFCRKKQWNNPSSTGQSYEFIKNEIKRLKYYRLDELLANPPKVTINTKK